MISKENLQEVKAALYMNCKSSKFCCKCLEKLCDGHHCFHAGTLKIGPLESLQQIVNNVINDTSPQRFRITEVCHFLESNDYINFSDHIADLNMFGTVWFFCTEKLWKEQQAIEENGGQESLGAWY